MGLNILYIADILFFLNDKRLSIPSLIPDDANSTFHDWREVLALEYIQPQRLGSAANIR